MLKDPGVETQIMDVGGVMVHQLLCGRDVARPGKASDVMAGKIFEFASSMRNFVYLVVDPTTSEALVLDACWDVEGIFRYADELGVKITGAIYTHSHFDHAGGHVPPQMTGGMPVLLPGAQDLVKRKIPVYAGATDCKAISDQCQLPANALGVLEEGSSVNAGLSKCVAFHTPGHTPGSICLFVPCGGGASGRLPSQPSVKVPANQGALISGDTLFVDSCGRTDLPGSDQMGMFKSLSRLCQGLPDGCIVCPGHDYSPVPWTTIAEERTTNQMVTMGLQMVSSPGRLADYPRCKCMGRFREAAEDIFVGKPALSIASLGGGELGLDGVPVHAKLVDLRVLLFHYIRSSKDAEAKSGKLRSPTDLTLSDGSGNRQLKDEDNLSDPALAAEGLAVFGAELPDGSARRSWYQPGDDVVLGGLKGAPELNGETGEVRKWGAAKGRYEVSLKTNSQMKSVKADNLFRPEPAAPPVPDAPDVPDVD